MPTIQWTNPKKDILFNVDTIIRNTYIAALKATSGNVSQAATKLGIDRRTAQRNMQYYDLNKENFRQVPTKSSGSLVETGSAN